MINNNNFIRQNKIKIKIFKKNLSSRRLKFVRLKMEAKKLKLI